MPDEVILDRLQLILEHASVIAGRVQRISDEDNIQKPEEEEIVIDSLITRLQALSENIKKIQKIDSSFFKTVIPLNTDSIVRFRDLASHHYEKLDETMVVQICQSNVPVVAQAIQAYLQKLR